MNFSFFSTIRSIHFIITILLAFSIKSLAFGTNVAEAAVLVALCAVVGAYLYLTHTDEKWQEKHEKKMLELEEEYNVKLDAITKDLIQMNGRLNMVSSELQIRKDRSEQAITQVFKRKF